MSAMPAQRPSTSTQAVGTPVRFLDAARRLFSIKEFSVDLAADPSNAVCDVFLTEAVNALAPEVRWRDYCGSKGWGWLNPPFKEIGPWVEKAWRESRNGARLMVLVPAATDTQWWDSHVRGKAYIIYIKGRFAFVGHTAHYPKGLALLVYAPFLKGGDRVWAWTDDADR
jgi:phage N-6-adenine-methyltransferase